MAASYLGSVCESVYLFPHLGPLQVALRKNNPDCIIIVYVRKFRDVKGCFTISSKFLCPGLERFLFLPPVKPPPVENMPQNAGWDFHHMSV